MSFIVYNSPEDVQKFRDYHDKITDHFDSEVMAEHYLNGLIDWDGNTLCDIHGSDPCDCFDVWPFT